MPKTKRAPNTTAEPAGANDGRRSLKDALISFVEPALKETGAAIAEQVRLYRWQRASIVEKARQFARQHNQPISSVPIKFLVPFLEVASAEDDAEMEDKWARLLTASMGDSFNSTRRALLDCLSRMGPREARLLTMFAMPEGGLMAPFMSALGGNPSFDSDEIWETFSAVLAASKKNRRRVLREQSNKAFTHILTQGGLPAFYEVAHPSIPDDDQAIFQSSLGDWQNELLLLVNLRLLEDRSITEKFYSNIDEVAKAIDGAPVGDNRSSFCCRWFCLTYLGQEFLRVCEGQVPTAPQHLNAGWFKQMQEAATEAKSRQPKRKK